MIRLKPPSHSVDRGGVFIPPSDDAWCQEVMAADMDAVEAKALAEFQDAVEAKYRDEQRQRKIEVTAEEVAALRESCVLSDEQRSEAHRTLPFIRYAQGDTRFDIDCSDWDGEGKPCTLRSRYLTKGAPTKFYIRRLRPSDYHAAEGIENSGERLLEFCRLGLKGIESPDYKWTAEESKKRAPEDVIQALHDADVSLPMQIGTAVILFCRKLNKAELFR